MAARRALVAGTTSVFAELGTVGDTLEVLAAGLISSSGPLVLAGANNIVQIPVTDTLDVAKIDRVGTITIGAAGATGISIGSGGAGGVLTTIAGDLAVTGNETITGTSVFTADATFNGNVTIGNDPTDTANFGGGAVTATSNPTWNFGTGQADFGGNLDANAGLDVTGGALTFTGTAGSWTVAQADSALTQTGTGQVAMTGNVDVGAGLDVTGVLTQTGGQVTLAGNVDATAGLDVTGILTQTGGQVTLGGNVDATAGLDVTGGNGITVDGMIIDSDGTSGLLLGGAATTVAPRTTQLTTVQRDALTADDGMFVWNTTTSNFQWYDGVTWQSVPTASSAGGWTDDGGVVRLTTIGDDVAIGSLLMFGTEKLRVVGAARIEGALTQTTGQVTLGGNVDATAGLDVSGGALTFTGTAGSWTVAQADSALTQTGTGQVTMTGNVDVGAGLDVTGVLTQTGGQVTLAGNVDATGGLDVTGVLTQSTGQVTLGGNVDATDGLDVTGGSLTFTGTAGSWTTAEADSALTQTGSGQVTMTGNVDVGAGLDVTGVLTQTGGQVTLAGNVDATAGLDVSGGAQTFTGTAGSWTIAQADSALTQTGSGQVTMTGNVDADAGLDVDGQITLVESVGLTAYMDLTDGDNSPVSALNHGRIRYNEALDYFEVSESGTAWKQMVGAASAPQYTGKAGEAIAVGQLVCVEWDAVNTEPRVYLCDANDAGDNDSNPVGVAINAAATGASVSVQLGGESGVLPDAAWDAVPTTTASGADVYMSETAGKLTLVIPTGNVRAQQVGNVSAVGSGAAKMIIHVMAALKKAA